MREVLKDQANGMVGKTVIHPSHLTVVNALQAVTLEEYEDSLQIVSAQGGAIKSSRSNKMNEVGPHATWANLILKRGDAYGVIESGSDYLHLMKP